MAEDILTRNDYQLRERLFHIPCKNQFITIYYESSSTSLSTNDGGNKVARSIFVFLVFRSFSCLTLGSFQFGNGLFSRNSDPSEYFKSCTSCAICRGESSSSCSSSCTCVRCDRGPNGRVHPSIILGIAIRMFAGADPLDLITSFGVSKTIVHDSVDHVINAVCMSKSLKIAFPREHQEQLRIAKEFEVISDAKFRSCVGDRWNVGLVIQTKRKRMQENRSWIRKILLWTEKKFGLNLQATVTSTRKFIALSIKYPGSSSDFMAFENSDLRRELETSNFLYPPRFVFVWR